MSTKRILIALSACAATFVGGYGVRVLAEGAPAEQPLFYSGVLESNGSLASGEHTITLELFDAQSGGNQLCAIERASEVVAGRFRIDASECADAMRENADAWVAVSFVSDDGVERTISGRSKVGAVPYALEADRAKTASAATGELETTIEQLSTRIAALEAGGGGGPPLALTAFQAIKTMHEPLAIGGTHLTFDNEIFDLTDEHNAETGVFVAQQAGRYEFFCSIAWNGHYGEGRYATRQVHAVVELVEGQEVWCASWQSDDTVTLNLRDALTSFEGRRFSL